MVLSKTKNNASVLAEEYTVIWKKSIYYTIFIFQTAIFNEKAYNAFAAAAKHKLPFALTKSISFQPKKHYTHIFTPGLPIAGSEAASKKQAAVTAIHPDFTGCTVLQNGEKSLLLTTTDVSVPALICRKKAMLFLQGIQQSAMVMHMHIHPRRYPHKRSRNADQKVWVYKAACFMQEIQ